METAKPLLVVEDAPEVLRMLDQILRLNGYEVMTARDGQEALEAVQKQRPELIVTDILMPRMDGFSLIYRLRRDMATRDIPVVFLTATFVSGDDRDFATTIGATRFVQKPIDTQDFLKMIAELLGQPKGPIPAAPQEDQFFDKYQVRLEAKLAEKKSQITRAQQALANVPANERPSFDAVLRQALQDQEMVEVELRQVREFLEQRKNP